MQGALDEFGSVLQKIKQNQPDDPQLQQLDSLLLAPHSKKS